MKKFRNQVCSIILAYGIRMLSNDVIVEHRYRKGKVTHSMSGIAHGCVCPMAVATTESFKMAPILLS